MRTTTITHPLRALLPAVALLALNACSSTDLATETPDHHHTPGRVITIDAGFGADAPTSRMVHDYDTNENTIDVKWTDGDAFKIYKGGEGSILTTTLTEPSASASFTGTDPEDKGAGNTYKFLYPAYKAAEYESEAVMSLLAQVQTKATGEDGEGNVNHLPAYNYMVVQGTTELPASLTFNPAVAILRIEVPEVEFYSLQSLTISLENNQDIVVIQNAFTTDKQTSKNLTMTFKGYEENEAVTAYMAIFPTTIGGTADEKIYFSATYANSEGGFTHRMSKKSEITESTKLPFSAAKVYKVTPTAWSEDTDVIAYNGQNPTEVEAFGGGDGSSEATAYEISNTKQLQKLINDVNAGTDSYSGKYFKLTKDICIPPSPSWAPIGYTSGTTKVAFQGIFDGCGHTISGRLRSGAGVESFGFFGFVSGADNDHWAVIKNLHVAADVAGADNSYLGGVVGNSDPYTLLENCTMSGKVSASSQTNRLYVGGVVGASEKPYKVINCSSLGSMNVSVTGTNELCLGGVCGGYKTVTILPADSEISGCLNRADITVRKNALSGWCYLGGITAGYWDGFMNAPTYCIPIKNCINEGAVTYKGPDSGTSTSPIYIGGIVPGAMDCTLSNCRNYGAITGEGVCKSMIAGGLTASTGYVICHSSYNAGEIDTRNTTASTINYAGGLCGEDISLLMKTCNTNVGTVNGIAAPAAKRIGNDAGEESCAGH